MLYVHDDLRDHATRADEDRLQQEGYRKSCGRGGGGERKNVEKEEQSKENNAEKGEGYAKKSEEIRSKRK